MSFILYINTMKGDLWYRCHGGIMSKDIDYAHVFKNIGRASAVARREFRLGEGIKSYTIQNKDDLSHIYSRSEKEEDKKLKRIPMIWGFKRKNK